MLLLLLFRLLLIVLLILSRLLRLRIVGEAAVGFALFVGVRSLRILRLDGGRPRAVKRAGGIRIATAASQCGCLIVERAAAAIALLLITLLLITLSLVAVAVLRGFIILLALRRGGHTLDIALCDRAGASIADALGWCQGICRVAGGERKAETNGNQRCPDQSHLRDPFLRRSPRSGSLFYAANG